MKIFNGYQEKGVPRRMVLGVGNFDGLHLGHRAVIDGVMRLAGGTGRPAGLMTFHPHPMTVVGGGVAPAPLYTLEERTALMAETGLEVLIVQGFDRALAGMDHAAFAGGVLAGGLAPAALVVGSDFRFGARGSGDIASLRSAGDEHGFRVVVIERVEMDGQPVSSSRIRRLVSRGKVKEAARLLGRPFHLTGEVVGGEGLGRELGFPTANLRPPDKLIPADGVYAGEVAAGGATYPAAVNIGVPLRRLKEGRLIECHLLDFEGSLYGQRVEVRFLDKVREGLETDDTEMLSRQVEEDIARIREMLARRTG